MLLIDNAAYSYFFQLANGVPIIPYYHNKDDRELMWLQDYLMQFANAKCDDFTRVNRSVFKLKSYLDAATFEDALIILYSS